MEIEGGRFSARKLPSPIIHTDKQSNSFGSGDPRLKELFYPSHTKLTNTHRHTQNNRDKPNHTDKSRHTNTETYRQSYTDTHMWTQTVRLSE